MLRLEGVGFSSKVQPARQDSKAEKNDAV